MITCKQNDPAKNDPDVSRDLIDNGYKDTT